MKFFNRKLFFIFLLIFGALNASAQTGEFTYQGKLNDGAAAANGNYDFQFELHNSASSTTPLATTTRTNVTVTNGIFSVKLDFAPALFDGTPRFLKISVKSSGSPNPFTELAPYQPITSAPYSYKSLNAQNALNSATSDLAADSSRLGGITADQYVLTTDTRMSDARTPLPNSPNYVQNTTTQQSSSNFNVSGTGTANVLNATTQFNIGGNRVFSVAGSQNLFAGVSAGTSNSTGFGNAFFGNFAGNTNTTGRNNSFFGTDAGRNTNGNSNSFFGSSAGIATTSGGNNSFFGAVAGFSNTSGSFNTFYGNGAGLTNTVGGNNTAIGYLADFGSNNLNYATAIGSGSIVSTSNTIALGRNNGSDTVLIYGNLTLGGNLNVNGTLDFPAGDADYIQNRTTQQTSSNFNISGTGTANIFNASQYNIGGNRAFIAGPQSIFAGFNAGESNTSGFGNTFVGSFAGNVNSTGNNNTFVGSDAGRNTNGNGNSFFGRSAGYDTTSGSDNAFFGLDAGRFNQIGSQNAFFGKEAGFTTNSTGNSFFGFQAGKANTTGTTNTFVGWNAGANNTSGAGNVFIGSGAGNASPGTGNFNIVIGNNSFVGPTTTGAIVIGNLANNTDSNTMLLSSSIIKFDGFADFQGEAYFRNFVRLTQLISSGSQPVCLNSFLYFAVCSSSLRYKSNIQTFTGGLDLLRRFRPVTFDWKTDGKRDIGFVAEEVAEIEPLLATKNEKGEIEGVKYAQITTVLVNSIKEQQTQIETQQKQIAEQQRQIEALKKLVCASNPTAEICKE